MADKHDTRGTDGLVTVMHDNGDGTYAPLVYISGVSITDPSGLATAANQTTGNAALGTTTGAAVVTDANGTLQGYLRGLVKLLAARGAYASPTHTAPVVTTDSGTVLAANASRKYALLINDSDAVIYLALGTAAALNQGIRLNANGGSYEMSAAGGNLYTGAVYAIHGSTGDKVVLATEGV